ncbi:MAG TPA: CoA transferase [Dehalococcoidia bacterium]|nr:CoA transferase [Dehalococcoidia bacterium]
MAESAARRTYACAEGEITIVIENAEHWHALAVCLGRPEVAYEGAWTAAKDAPADGPLAAVIAEMFAEDTAASWGRRLAAHGVPHSLRS